MPIWKTSVAMIRHTQILLIWSFLFGGFCIRAQTTEKDSLRNPYSPYYLTDFKLREVAQLIVQDSIHPTDNNVTLSIMDSIVSGNLESRNYFSNAFDVIIIKSDGALSEVIGQYCINSIYNNPNELINWLYIGKLESTPESIVGYITYELVLANDPKKEKEDLINKIMHDAQNSSLIEYANKFVALIEDDFERQINE